jgi:hypothetical protein
VQAAGKLVSFWHALVPLAHLKCYRGEVPRVGGIICQNHISTRHEAVNKGHGRQPRGGLPEESTAAFRNAVSPVSLLPVLTYGQCDPLLAGSAKVSQQYASAAAAARSNTSAISLPPEGHLSGEPCMHFAPVNPF